MKRPIELQALETYRLWLKYDDGTEGTVDLSDLADRGVFKAWNEPGVFGKAHITEDGAVAWTDEIELCSDALYLRLTDQTSDELFFPQPVAPSSRGISD